MWRNRWFLVTCVLAGVMMARAQNVPTYGDVSYVPGGDAKQMLDVYLPADADALLPTVVLLHGQGADGSRGRVLIPQRDHLLELGYAVVVADFRASGYPMVADAFCVFAWLHQEGDAFGLDARRAAVLSHYTATYPAAFLATVDAPDPFLEGCPYELPMDAKPAGVIAYEAERYNTPGEVDTGSVFQYAFTAGFTSLGEIGGYLTEMEAVPRERWATDLSEDARRFAERSLPAYWIDGNDAPLLLIDGEADEHHVTSVRLVELFEESGSEAELLLVPGSSGGMSLFDFDPAFVDEAAERFLEEHLAR